MNDILLGVVILAVIGMVFMLYKYSKFIHHYHDKDGQSADGGASTNETPPTDDGPGGGGDGGGRNGGD